MLLFFYALARECRCSFFKRLTTNINCSGYNQKTKKISHIIKSILLLNSLYYFYLLADVSQLAANVWHIGAVAASKYFPAGDKLPFRTVFSSGGSAAIEPICSLAAVASHIVFLSNSTIIFQFYFFKIPTPCLERVRKP
jgi:hypothetical protein